VAAPTYRSTNNGSATGVAPTVSVTTPSGTVNGDLMIAIGSVGTSTGAAWSTPTGWTLLDTSAASNNATHVATWYKIAASEGATLSFPSTGTASVTARVEVVTYTGVDQTTPVDVHSMQATVAASPAVAPTVTTTGADRRIVRLYSSSSNTSTFSTPTSHTEQVDAGGFSCDDVAQAVAGASGSASSTVTGSVIVCGAATVAIMPPQTQNLTTTLSCTVSYSTARALTPGHVLASSTTWTATRTRMPTHVLASPVTWTATAVAVKVLLLALSCLISLAAVARRLPQRALAVTTALSATAARRPTKGLASGITWSAIRGGTQALALACAISYTASAAAIHALTLACTITYGVARTRAISTARAVSVALSTTRARTVNRTNAVTTTLTATRTRQVSRLRAVTITWSSALTLPVRLARTVLGVAKHVAAVLRERPSARTATKARTTVSVELHDKPLNP
jgi:hypothetical protein